MGSFRVSENVLAVDLPQTEGLPKVFALLQNYPNPFNPTTTIRYELPKETKVSLKLYNILGQEVRTLVSGVQHSGRYAVELNAHSLASGIYIYRLESGTFVQSRTLCLIK